MGTRRSAGDIAALLSFAVFLKRLFEDQIGSVVSPNPRALDLPCSYLT